MVAAANRYAEFQEGFAAPTSVDWRNNGGNFVTSVKDQGNCGSCVSFGTLGAIEGRINIACRTPGGERDYAEAFLFYCGCGNCCGQGWNFAPALNFCRDTGVALESAFPYTPGDQPCKAGVPVSFKITGYSTAASMADRKAAISRGPVVAGLAVYTDFYAYRTGIYRQTSGVLEGYHAVAAVGYDDGQGCWICKNSWGTNWGESGFFRIAYGQVEMDTTFSFYEPQVACPTPPPPVDECARYIPYLQRVLQVAASHSGLRACLRYYICRRGVRPRCSEAILAVVRIVIDILNRCPQYRQPFCRALG
jgi:C1A family cysteine protease